MRLTHVAAPLLAALLAACATGGGTANVRPQRMIPNATSEQVREAIVLGCVQRGYRIDRADTNQVVCSRDPGIMANALLTTGAGPGPRYQFVANMAQTGTAEQPSVYVTAWTVLQAYTWTGAEGMGEASMSNREAQSIQAFLDTLIAAQPEPKPEPEPGH